MKKLLALVLALTMVLCAAMAAAEGVAVMTHAGFIALEMDSPVTVETYVQAHQILKEGKVSVYAQSEDGAYFLYGVPCTEEELAKLVPGTKIRVSGYKTEWSGEVEIGDATIEILEGDPFIAEAADVTALLGADEIIDRQNEFVAFKGMTVEPIKIQDDETEYAFLYSWDGSGTREGNSDLYFNVSVNGQTYQFTVESDLCGNETDVYKAVENLKVGDTVDLEGFLYWYNGVNPHITKIEVK